MGLALVRSGHHSELHVISLIKPLSIFDLEDQMTNGGCMVLIQRFNAQIRGREENIGTAYHLYVSAVSDKVT